MEYFYNLWSSSIPGTYVRQSNFGGDSRSCPKALDSSGGFVVRSIVRPLSSLRLEFFP